MKIFKQIFYTILSTWLLVTASFSHAQVSENLLREFSKCDASFFHALKDEKELWRKFSPITDQEGVSYIKVPNRSEEGRNRIALDAPPSYMGLPFLKYMDETLDLGSSGMIYSWGFVVKGNVEDVKNKLFPLIVNNSRLRKDSY